MPRQRTDSVRSGVLLVALALAAFALFPVAASAVEDGVCLDPPAGMTGWWPGDNSPADIIGDPAHDATLTGQTTYAPGKVAGAFALDGDGDFVSVASDPAFDVGAGDFTIDLWVYFNDTSGEQILVERYVENFTAPEGWTLTKLPNNSLAFGRGGSSDILISGVIPEIQAAQWVHVAARRSALVGEIFVNGNSVVSGTLSYNADFTGTNDSSLKFGHRGNPGDTPGSTDTRQFYLDGRIDEVEFFVGTALTGAEIMAIYAEGADGKCRPNDPPEVASNLDLVALDEGATALNSGSVSDPNGDIVTLDASAGDVVNNNDGTWSWSFATNDGPAQSQTVTISANDGNGGSAESTFDLVVNNVAPTITAVAGPVAPIAIGDQPIAVDVTWTDPGTGDTHDVIWTWGDGSPDDTQQSASSPASETHTYAEPGVYPVTVTVVDDDGGLDTESLGFVVIYDPSGGFVTGGGWINSPAGAYEADPTLTGKAHFAFQSEYKSGATTPTGNTRFRFSAGGMVFHSDSYDWLVIAGSDRAKYKGVGSINGGGNYGFMLTAVDNGNSGDTFRIKIWDKDAGDAVVYDNKLGSGDDTYDGTAIVGGNIKVHKK